MNNDLVTLIRSPSEIRNRAHIILELGLENKLDHFQVNIDKFPDVVDFVAETILSEYPKLDIPYHSRWRHFDIDNIDRWKNISDKISDDKSEIIRSAIDLVVISVLLDAGSGPDWQYHEKNTGIKIGRSEGLALASFDMFCAGLFSSNPNNPYQVDAEALKNVNAQSLSDAFQITDNNPMHGFDGRCQLLQQLSNALTQHPDIFGTEPARPGNLFNLLSKDKTEIKAKDILKTLLTGFETIWPGRITLDDANLGDVWHHSKIETDDKTNNMMPFHKLSQWLTYSLLEPFEWFGITITGLDDLTGLAEYRNGGLFIDLGVLVPKSADTLTKPLHPSDEIIVEWRALTVAMLDNLRPLVAEKLGLNDADFPLAKLLQGGSWTAGRLTAKKRDPEFGRPPINIISDGTVF